MTLAIIDDVEEITHLADGLTVTQVLALVIVALLIAALWLVRAWVRDDLVSGKRHREKCKECLYWRKLAMQGREFAEVAENDLRELAASLQHKAGGN